jgi:hypothetical protein
MGCVDLVDRIVKGGGWIIVPLRPGPPPVPINAQESVMSACPTCPNCPPAPPAHVAMAHSYKWSPSADRRHWFLSQDGRQTGTYVCGTDTYHSIDYQGKFSEAVPPVPVPRQAWPARGPSDLPTGVITSRLGNGPSCSYQGRPCDFQQVMQALDDRIPSNAGKIWLHVGGGTPQERAQVESEFQQHPAFDAVRSHALVQSYPADAWATRPGLATEGRPAIQLMGPERPDGKAVVLYQWSSYPGASAVAAKMIEALRSVDPNFDPRKIAGPRQRLAADAMPLLAFLALGAVAVFVLLLMPKRRR